jgi:hypothetical protein
MPDDRKPGLVALAAACLPRGRLRPHAILPLAVRELEDDDFIMSLTPKPLTGSMQAGWSGGC